MCLPPAREKRGIVRDVTSITPANGHGYRCTNACDGGSCHGGPVPARAPRSARAGIGPAAPPADKPLRQRFPVPGRGRAEGVLLHVAVKLIQLRGLDAVDVLGARELAGADLVRVAAKAI